MPDWLLFTTKITSQAKYQQSQALLIVIQSADIQFSLAEVQSGLQDYDTRPEWTRKIAVFAQFLPEKARKLEKFCEAVNMSAVVFDDLHPACTWLNLSLPEINLAVCRLLRKV